MGCVYVFMLRYWQEYGDEETRIGWLNEKRSLLPWGLRVPIKKNKFLF